MVQMKFFFNLLLSTIVFVLIACNVHAQSTQFFTPNDSVPRIELRYQHPFYKSDNTDMVKSTVDKNPLYSAVYELAFSFPLSKSWQMHTSLPFCITDYQMTIKGIGQDGYGGYYNPSQGLLDPLLSKDYVISESSKAWGNLMIGFSYSKALNKKHYLKWHSNVFLPTASRRKSGSVWHMMCSNATEIYRYANNATTLYTQIQYGSDKATGFNYFISGGFHGTTTGTQAIIEESFNLNYSLGGRFSTESITASCELMGLNNLKDGYDNFHGKSLNSLNVGMHYTKGAFIPSFFYSMYLKDEMRDVVSGVLGIKLAYRITK